MPRGREEGREGSHQTALGQPGPREGGISGMIVSFIFLAWAMLGHGKACVVHFAESTEVNWDCLGHAGPYGHPSRGQCV